MLDDFRNTQDENYEEGTVQASVQPEYEPAPTSGRFLGMTPFQRFIIIFLIFMLTCVLGSFCLLVTEKIIPPFF